MNRNQVKASYRRMLGAFETITIRRYSGTGEARTSEEFDCLGKPVGFAPHELVGSVVDGDSKVFAFVDDLVAAGIGLPLSTASDRLVLEGRELSIFGIDASTIRIGGETIAYILQARGGIRAGVEGPSLDFSKSRNSGYLALLEDI